MNRFAVLSKIVLIILSSLVGVIPAWSQKAIGKVSGKVSDQSTNESLAGVTIVGKGTKYTSLSIADGSYQISLPPGTYTLRFSYTGYKTKELTGVLVQTTQSTIIDVLMETNAGGLQNVVVTANVKREAQSAVYSAQKRSAAVSDGISQEAIRRTPDNNTAQVLKRVTGINVQDNRFVVVRGLGEQYNQTVLNGVPMTSTETNRNAFAFDLIPAPVVENITVNKTATPDMPGNFAGGVVQINTKDFPDKNFFSVLIQGGFADQTIGREYYSDKGGKFDWLGFAGKNKDLPAHFPVTTAQVPFTSLNVQEQTRYFRMLKNNLVPTDHGYGIPNDNVQLGYGKTINFKADNKLGIVVAINHRRTYLIENETIARDPSLTTGAAPYDSLQGLGYYSKHIRHRSTVDFGGVLNLAYRFGNSKISLKTLYTRVLTNTFTFRPDIITDIPAFAASDATPVRLGLSYYTEERQVLNSTLAGEHRTGKNNETKIDWNVSISRYSQYVPDTRNFILLTDSNRKEFVQSSNAGILESLIGFSRVWTDSRDLIAGGAFNVTTPFLLGKSKQLLKGGILFQNRTRQSEGTILPISGLSGSIDSLLQPSNFYPGGGQVNVPGAYLVEGSGNYTAGSSSLAAYESLENRIGTKIRIIWGIRAENYQQTVNVYKPYFYEGFSTPDLSSVKFAARNTFNFLPSANFVYSPRSSINIRAAYSNTVIRPELKDLAEFQRFDLQTFALSTGNRDLKSSSITNYDLKFEWFPSSGELLSAAAFYKTIRDPIEYAFSDLSNNLSSKYAINTGKAYVKGVEGEIRKKIDFIKVAPWLSHLTLFGNGALLVSKVESKELNSFVLSSFAEHRLTGQPKYIINAGMSVLAMKDRFEFTLSYNRTGDYINELGSSDLDVHLASGKSVPLRPHYYVQARDLVDLVVSQSFLKDRARIKLNIGNLLKRYYLLYQDLNGNQKFDAPVVIDPSYRFDRTNNYRSGTDNTASKIEGQRIYSLAFSYTF